MIEQLHVETLGPHGENLAEVLDALHGDQRDRFEEIEAALRQMVPGFNRSAKQTLGARYVAGTSTESTAASTRRSIASVIGDAAAGSRTSSPRSKLESSRPCLAVCGAEAP